MKEAILRYAPTYSPKAFNDLAKYCTLQASAPGVFFWSGEHAVLSGGVGVCQQVPLRVWVGLEQVDASQTDGQAIKLSPDPSHHLGCEHSTTGDERQLTPITKFIEWAQIPTALKWLGNRATELGMRGHYLVRTAHEVRPASGCNWSGAFANAVTACVLQQISSCGSPDPRKEALISDEIVAGWSAGVYVQRAGEPPSTADHAWGLAEFNRLAWKVETILHKGRASGYGTLCSAVPEKGPIIYVTGDRKREGIPANLIEDDLDLVDRLSAVAIPLVTSLGLDEAVLEHVPIAYGLASTGVPKVTGDSIVGTEDLAKYFDITVVPEVAGVLNIPECQAVIAANERLEAVATQATDGSLSIGELLRNEQVRAVGTSSLVAASAMTTLLKGTACGASVNVQDENMARLAQALRRNQGGLTQLGLEWREGREVAEAMYRLAYKAKISQATAVKMTGGGRGGHVLVMLPKDRSTHEAIEAELAKARDVFGFGKDAMRLEWFSVRPGDELDGRGLVVHRKTEGPSETGLS